MPISICITSFKIIILDKGGVCYAGKQKKGYSKNCSRFPRLVAILVGDAPSVNEKYVPVYNAYNGQTETMETKWANLKKMEEETFSKIVMGKADISEFDTFVKNWKSQGGDQILKEINEELSK